MVEIRNLMMRRDSPSYYVLEKGRLITLDYEGLESDFGILNPSRLQTLTLQELQTTYPQSLAQLVNYSIGKILRRLGVGFSGGRSYFLADRQVKEGKSRVLGLLSGETLQVAKPYSSPVKENTLEGENPKRLNFVFHMAFRLRYRSLWGRHFIEFGLGKLYTEDGVTVIEGKRAARLDGRFRNPAFDRSETRQRKLEKLAGYVFHSRRRSSPSWLGMFNFGEFLRIQTNWTPDTVPLNQGIMDDFTSTKETGEDE
jgi:hypothetical protein